MVLSVIWQRNSHLGAQLPASNERLSQAAKNRQGLLTDYQPKNMLNFLKNNPQLTE